MSLGLGKACSVGFVSMGAMGLLGGCGEEFYMLHKQEARVGNEWFAIGMACMSITGGSSGGVHGDEVSGQDTGYSLDIGVEDWEGRFAYTLNGEVVEERVFDEDFLRSGQVEQLDIELPDGERRRFFFWGASECPVLDDLDFKAYERAKRAAESTESDDEGEDSEAEDARVGP